MKRKYFYIPAIVCILIAGVSLWLFGSKYERAHFPIRHVIVRGEYWQVSQADLQAIIAPYTKSGYFLINLFSLRHQLLEKEPWIQTVNISRLWPESILIVLKQKTAVATLNNNALVTQTGEVFSPPVNTFPPELPLFMGPKEKSVELLKNYQLFTSVADSANLSVIELDLSPEGNWTVALFYEQPCFEGLKDMRTKEGKELEHRMCVPEKPQNRAVVNNKIVVMLGDDDILAKFKRFIKVYEQVFVPQHREPSYVDMRYSHGMAVNWK